MFGIVIVTTKKAMPSGKKYFGETATARIKLMRTKANPESLHCDAEIFLVKNDITLNHP